MSPLLELKNLSFSTGKKPILINFNLKIQPGELLVFTGRNGSGKSTLADLIMGLKRPSSGQIFFNGEDITSASITARAQAGLSLAFQTPVAFRGVKVKDLLVPPRDSKTPPQSAPNSDSKSVLSPTQILHQLGLDSEEYLSREFNSSLSGGERKRLEIASVLAKPNTKLYILDEPEAGIDLWSFDNLISLLKQLKKSHTLLIISHNPQIIKLATRVITLC